MKVPYDEGLAGHIGLESCVHVCKDMGEALRGGRVGQVLSRESRLSPGRRRRQLDRKVIQGTSIRREVFWPCVVEDPAHVWKLSAREPGDPTFALGELTMGRTENPEGARQRWMDMGSKTHSTEETAEHGAVRGCSVEEVEGRGLAEGNPIYENKLWAQYRKKPVN